MKVRDEAYMMNEWVGVRSFPFILPLIEKYEVGTITLDEVYKELDNTDYMNLCMYEKFNLGYFVRNKKFPEGMITIAHEAEQGKIYKGGLCVISEPRYCNTIIYIDDKYELVVVWEDKRNKK